MGCCGSAEQPVAAQKGDSKLKSQPRVLPSREVEGLAEDKVAEFKGHIKSLEVAVRGKLDKFDKCSEEVPAGVEALADGDRKTFVRDHLPKLVKGDMSSLLAKLNLPKEIKEALKSEPKDAAELGEALVKGCREMIKGPEIDEPVAKAAKCFQATTEQAKDIAGAKDVELEKEHAESLYKEINFSFLKEILDKVVKFVKDLFAKILAFIKYHIEELLTEAKEAATEALTDMLDKLKTEAVEKAPADAKDSVSDTIDSIKIDEMLDSLVSSIMDQVDKIDDIVEPVSNAVPALAKSINTNVRTKTFPVIWAHVAKEKPTANIGDFQQAVMDPPTEVLEQIPQPDVAAIQADLKKVAPEAEKAISEFPEKLEKKAVPEAEKLKKELQDKAEAKLKEEVDAKVKEAVKKASEEALGASVKALSGL